jgi:4-hydroxythreonine-4-phosphate dehydrogenase
VGPRLLITPGDPRGIGPEVSLRALGQFAAERPTASIEVMGPEGPLGLDGLDRLLKTAAESFDDSSAGSFAGGSIERAVEMALMGDADAVVTAPVHKPSLHAAGWKVPGQTELLAELAKVERVGMLMAAERTRLDASLRVLLATTHIPLREVPDAVTEALLVDQITLAHEALRTDWGFPQPRLGICGINPHASDQGLFGDEEEEVFAPAVARARTAGVDAVGPLPADTVFSRALNGEFHAVVAPYHDVGMAAFKTVSFGTGVNVSIGLPFIRTSPDHGTAFDIAGSGTADASSMIEALRMAYRLANNRFDMGSVDV